MTVESHDSSHAASASRLGALTEALTHTLHRIANEHAPAALACSLSVEDMVLIDAIHRERLPIGVFTLDTGRLHAETLALIPLIERRYGLRVDVFSPRPEAVAEYVTSHGRDAFYRSPALRHACCALRKLEPLERALAGKRAWVTGLRREQSANRGEVAVQSIDSARGIGKFAPLAEWTSADVWAYVRAHAVPYNRLHDEGYPSIGCAPCTRPVLPDEDPRAGRWWWEQAGPRECGLHVGADGRLARAAGRPGR